MGGAQGGHAGGECGGLLHSRGVPPAGSCGLFWGVRGWGVRVRGLVGGGLLAMVMRSVLRAHRASRQGEG